MYVVFWLVGLREAQRIEIYGKTRFSKYLAWNLASSTRRVGGIGPKGPLIHTIGKRDRVIAMAIAALVSAAEFMIVNVDLH